MDPSNDLVPSDRHALPQLFRGSHVSEKLTLEFFLARIPNPHTRRAYALAAADFGRWASAHGIRSLEAVEPFHVATYIEELKLRLAAPSVKQKLAALRSLFDWLVVNQVIARNPAHAVRGPKHVVKQGKTPVLTAAEARELLDAIDTSTVVGLRDRALIALLVYSFARVGAAVTMRVEDVFTQGRRLWVRLHEKGGKVHTMPAHHNLEAYLHVYLEAAGLAGDSKGPLFRSTRGRSKSLTAHPLSQADVWRMIRRRADQAEIATAIGCHTFRATGITEYLKNGGRLEVAQAMANHESPRTTRLYDRREDQVSLDEVERILI